MQVKRIDLSLTMLGLALILISSYYLFGDNDQESSLLPSIAKLNFTDSTVKTKKSQSLNWNDARAGLNLFSDQMIYTYSGATATIKFNQGHEVEVEENSLLKIKSELGESISVEKGYLRAKISKGSPLHVNVKGKDLVLEGDDASVMLNIGKENIEVGILQGDVKVSKDQESVMINSEKSLTVLSTGEMKSKENIAVPTNPTTGKKIFTSLNMAEVNFAWTAKTPQLDIEISSDPQFAESLISQTVDGINFNTSLKAGTYYWRLKSEQSKSVTSSFSVINEKPPVILQPLSGEIMVFSESANPEKGIVDMRWKDTGRKFFIELDEDGNISNHQSDKHFFQYKVLKTTLLKWRVKNLAADHPEAIFSDWQEIQIKVLPPLSVPEIIFPVTADIAVYEDPIKPVQFKWKQAPDTEALLEILENDKIIESFKVLTNGEYSWYPKKTGEFQWRVSQYDQAGQKSKFSSLGIFSLMDLRDATLDAGVYRIQLKRPDQKAKFEWENDKAVVANFELAEDKTFSKVIYKTSAQTSAEVNVAKLGTYYWRNSLKTKPKKVIIEPIPAPLKPQKLPDVEIPVEWKLKNSQSSWWKKITNLLISEAWAEDFVSAAKIEIPAQEHVKSYLIEIYSDLEMSQLLFQKKSNTPNFEWENPHPGQNYFRYAVIDYFDRQSPFSDLSLLKIISTTQPESLQKPLLSYPIRKVKIETESNTINFQWSVVPSIKKYQLEISKDEDFNEITYTAESETNNLEVEKTRLPLEDLLFWRVKVSNKNISKLSSTGKFSVALPIQLATENKPLDKVDLLKTRRAEFLWMPSMDTYTFSQGAISGDIKGNVLVSVLARLQIPLSFMSTEFQVFRQSGKVFSSEKYLYQTLEAKAFKTFKEHYFYGLAVQMVSAQTYAVASGAIKATSYSGLNYGPLLGLTFDVKNLQNQVGLTYLLGTIPTMDLFLRSTYFRKTNQYYVLELGYASRDYKKETYTGTQTSLRVGAGLGFSF